MFSDSAAAAVKDITSNSAVAAIFVSRCHAAFLEEYLSLTPQEQELIGVDLDTLHDQSAFLAPGKDHRCNGLIQATTICLYQILLYISEAEQQAVELGDLTEHILETTGLCSGLIPAAVIASSSTLVDVVNYGVEAIRVAFWTAYRVVLEGQKQAGVLDNHDAWSLAVLGLSLSQVKEELERFCVQVGVSVVPAFQTWPLNLYPDSATVPSNLSNHESQSYLNIWSALTSVDVPKTFRKCCHNHESTCQCVVPRR